MTGESILATLQDRFAAAIRKVAPEAPAASSWVRASQDARFGDYQCNAAMVLAKTLQQAARQVAERIVAAVELSDLAEPLEIAGPGFINVRLKADFLAGVLNGIEPSAAHEDRFGIPATSAPKTVVIDYSSPNVAKQMHVGHIRSTIIGDVLARSLAFAGHRVIRQNHVGDWGTQFGILIAYYRRHLMPTHSATSDVLDAIEDDYRAATELFQSDAAFAAEARAAVGALQGGDAEARRVWREICAQSRQAFTFVYARLGVLLTNEDVCGESFYNDRLARTVADLRAALPVRPKDTPAPGPYAELRQDQGAVCIYLYDANHQPRFRNAEGNELPLIIQKSDGAFLYASTDLAALRYRARELAGQRLIYVTDARQKLHFQMFFAAAEAAGWTRGVALEHVTFGSMLGEDRKPLKTREGRNVKLRELLDEARQRALAVLEQRGERPDAPQDALDLTGPAALAVAEHVGIAAVKYADLSRDRNTDYVFNWETMLSLQGNTAPYLLYAYARIRSIERKAQARPLRAAGEAVEFSGPIRIDAPAERSLALRLARLHETVDSLGRDLLPHVLCAYLYELAGDFMRFYEACPVLAAEDAGVRASRLRLCDLTARALKLSLGLLGIGVIDRM